MESGTVNHIVEADIRGFFDNVGQNQLMQFLSHRIADKRVLRYIKRFLKAGISEDGYIEPVNGEPRCAGSPLLANIYLHYTLDLWFERRFRRSCTGYARLIRYADDFVVCFQQGSDAKRFRMKRKTVSKRFTGKVKAVKEWLKSNRTLPTTMLLQLLSAKLAGHYAYYGVTDNSKSIGDFYY